MKKTPGPQSSSFSRSCPGSAVREQVEEIIVTAEKWERAASTIGMSITTATDDMLQERGCPTIGPSS